MSVLLGVTASCFTLPLILPHTHADAHTHILSYTLFQGISFLHKDRHTHTHGSETLDPSRCPSVGVICVTPPLTPVCDSSPLITHTSALWHMAAGTLHGAFKGIRLSSMEYFDLGVTGTKRIRTHTHIGGCTACTVQVVMGDVRGEFYSSGFRHR